MPQKAYSYTNCFIDKAYKIKFNLKFNLILKLQDAEKQKKVASRINFR